MFGDGDEKESFVDAFGACHGFVVGLFWKLLMSINED